MAERIPESSSPAEVGGSQLTQGLRSRRVAIIVVSKHHGNTMQVARLLAGVLRADLYSPEQVTAEILEKQDLVGYGSGIYFARHDRRLLELVKSAPLIPKRAFMFSTSGSPFLFHWYHGSLRRQLRRRGCEIVGEFNCPGWDTFGPFAWFGGFYRGHPNERDLERAQEFGFKLLQKDP